MKQHNWKSAGALQWGEAGLSGTDAQSYFECEHCHQKIAVHYNAGEGHGEAMKQAGVGLECPQGVEVSGKTKIYCMVNGRFGSDYSGIAVCEDGHVLAGHISSTPGWAMHDLGIGSESKHPMYSHHCPEGFELIWVETEEVRRQLDAKEGPLWETMQKNKELGELTEAKEAAKAHEHP